MPQIIPSNQPSLSSILPPNSFYPTLLVNVPPSAESVTASLLKNATNLATPLTLARRNSSGDLSTRVMSVKHLIGSDYTNSSPVISFNNEDGSGFGSVQGSDLAGRINANVQQYSANSDIFTVTYNTPFDYAPIVILTPGNAVTAALSGTQVPFLRAYNTDSFTLGSNSAVLPAGNYSWNYMVVSPGQNNID